MTEQTTQTRWAAAQLRTLLANHGQLYTRRRTRRCRTRRLYPALESVSGTRTRPDHDTRGVRRS